MNRNATPSIARELAHNVATRADLARFVEALRQDLQRHPDEWENATLPEFLEALGGFLQDMDGYYRHRGEPVPNQPTWTTIAEILRGASAYE